MAQRGEAGRALAISAASTWAGGWIACVILVLLLPFSGNLVNMFHPPEFAAIIILALVLIAGTGESTSGTKIIMSGTIGLMLSFIGSDAVTGVERFTFGSSALLSGINVVPVALGLFALTQMVTMYSRNEAVTSGAEALKGSAFRRQVGQGLLDTAKLWVHVLRSATVASLLGLIPGIGGFSANFISYSLGRQVSRKSGEFGTGVPAGVASAEGSSLAKEVGSLIPAVALGLPSGVGMVIFIAALAILGIQTGPALLTSQPTLPYSMMWVLAVAGLLSCGIGLLITPWLSRATRVRGPVMMPVIIALAVLGSFASVTSFAGVIELGVFAIAGVVMRKLGYSLAAMTIGLVLGPTLADNLHLTQSIYGWGFAAHSPLADIFLVIAVGLLVLITMRSRRERDKGITTPQRAGRGPRGEHPVLEPVTEAVIAVISVIYLVIALGYPTEAGALPAVIAGITAAMALIRLSSHGIAALRARARAGATAAVLAEVGAGVVGVGGGGGETALAAVAAGGTAGGPVDAAGSLTETAQPTETGRPVETTRVERRRRLKREYVAIGWIWAAVVASYLFGFEIGVTVVVAAYSLTSIEWTRQWQRLVYAVAASAVGYGIAYTFVSLFHLSFTGRLA
jgi:putative tricarboxylic transport membrane protein